MKHTTVLVRYHFSIHPYYLALHRAPAMARRRSARHGGCSLIPQCTLLSPAIPDSACSSNHDHDAAHELQPGLLLVQKHNFQQQCKYHVEVPGWHESMSIERAARSWYQFHKSVP